MRRVLALLVAIAMFVSASPAFALNGSPARPPTNDFERFLDSPIGIATAVVAIGLVAIGLGKLAEKGKRGSAAESGKPGLYGVSGWSPQWERPYCATGGGLSSCISLDIDGEVGYPLTVNGPTASCRPGGSWSASPVEITASKLPPGLSFNDSFGITGIPTQRGHWPLGLKLATITCNGRTYDGLTQQLRFHIKGSGRVVE
jgi:hypothetical protein